MSRLPDFEGLAMFAKVAEERSFAAAARAMGVSVATVSRGVSRLEERFGARLLNRTSRQLALTEVGKIYRGERLPHLSRRRDDRRCCPGIVRSAARPRAPGGAD